jgi:hypothetical protein
VLQESWNSWSVGSQLLWMHAAQALPPAEASSFITHALAVELVPPSGSAGVPVAFELHPQASIPIVIKVVIGFIPLLRFHMQSRVASRRARSHANAATVSAIREPLGEALGQ